MAALLSTVIPGRARSADPLATLLTLRDASRSLSSCRAARGPVGDAPHPSRRVAEPVIVPRCARTRWRRSSPFETRRGACHRAALRADPLATLLTLRDASLCDAPQGEEERRGTTSRRPHAEERGVSRH